MLVMALASLKGGSGKTTLAGHLAVQAERDGAGPVALIDTDPQGSLSDWWNARGAQTPVFARTILAQLPRDIERMNRLGIRLLIVDTPAATALTIAHIVKLADLVVVPVRPSPHDLRAAGATVDMVEQLGKPLFFVINGATPRARITMDAVTALSRNGMMAPSVIHHRTDFASSMIDGRTVMEMPRGSRSVGEIERLWSYLRDRLFRDSPSADTDRLHQSAPPEVQFDVASNAGGG